jgi:type IV pilus assembly protein PilW
MRPDVKTQRNPSRGESGFTIVELMVGMLIGLIAIVVMFQVFAVSEGQRRTTTGAGDAQQNGVTSLYLMERDARMAGYGINFYSLLGCTVNAYWAPTAQAFSFNLAPVTIVNGPAGAPDSVTFLYTDTDTFSFPSITSTPGTVGTTGWVRIKDERFTYKPGSLFVIGEVPSAAGSQILRPCSMFQVSDLPAALSKQINFGGNTYVDESGNTRAANYTPPTAGSSGTQVPPNNLTYPQWSNTTKSGARIFNFGAQPTVMRYSIVNNQLVATDVLNPSVAPTPISDGIVQFQVQYGISGTCAANPATIVPCYISPTAANVTVGNFAADNWADTLPTAPAPLAANWRQIIAMRFVIIARSGQREKVNPVSGVCDATPALPVWSVNSRTIDLTADPLWQCYRYRKFEAVVPIRNMLWFPDPNGTNEDPSAT